jgi:hypothetical protein
MELFDEHPSLDLKMHSSSIPFARPWHVFEKGGDRKNRIKIGGFPQ